MLLLMAFLKNYSRGKMWRLKIMLEGWHIGPGALKDRCQSITLPFDLCSSARDGFTNIYAQGTEETWKEKEGVEVLAGGSKVVFWFFFIVFFFFQ